MTIPGSQLLDSNDSGVRDDPSRVRDDGDVLRTDGGGGGQLGLPLRHRRLEGPPAPMGSAPAHGSGWDYFEGTLDFESSKPSGFPAAVNLMFANLYNNWHGAQEIDTKFVSTLKIPTEVTLRLLF